MDARYPHPQPTPFEMTEAALRAGTHSARSLHFCDGCRTLVPELVYAATGGGGGIGGTKHLCEACAPPAVVKPAASFAHAAGRSRDVPPTLEEELLLYAMRNLPECWAAICRNVRDDAYVDRCLAAAFRARAAGPGGDDWVDLACCEFGPACRRLAPLVKSVNGWRFDAAFVLNRRQLAGAEPPAYFDAVPERLPAPPSAPVAPPPRRKPVRRHATGQPMFPSEAA